MERKLTRKFCKIIRKKVYALINKTLHNEVDALIKKTLCEKVDLLIKKNLAEFFRDRFHMSPTTSVTDDFFYNYITI